MSVIKRLASTGAALTVLGTLGVVGFTSTPAFAACGSGPNGETSVAHQESVGGKTNLTMEVMFSYMTCKASARVINGNAAALGKQGIKLYRRAGACKDSNPNGTQIATWAGTIPGKGDAKAVSAVTTPKACFRMYITADGNMYDGTQLYAG